MINTPFWTAHCLFWVFWLIEKTVRNKIIARIFDYLMYVCLGAQIMWTIMTIIR